LSMRCSALMRTTLVNGIATVLLTHTWHHKPLARTPCAEPRDVAAYVHCPCSTSSCLVCHIASESTLPSTSAHSHTE
jgi:hypothetical protein